MRKLPSNIQFFQPTERGKQLTLRVRDNFYACSAQCLQTLLYTWIQNKLGFTKLVESMECWIQLFSSSLYTRETILDNLGLEKSKRMFRIMMNLMNTL